MNGFDGVCEVLNRIKGTLQEAGLAMTAIAIRKDKFEQASSQECLFAVQWLESLERNEVETFRHAQRQHTPETWNNLKIIGSPTMPEFKILNGSRSDLKKAWSSRPALLTRKPYVAPKKAKQKAAKKSAARKSV